MGALARGAGYALISGLGWGDSLEMPALRRFSAAKLVPGACQQPAATVGKHQSGTRRSIGIASPIPRANASNSAKVMTPMADSDQVAAGGLQIMI